LKPTPFRARIAVLPRLAVLRAGCVLPLLVGLLLPAAPVHSAPKTGPSSAASMLVTMTASTSTVNPGGTIQYTIQVTNNGNVPLTNVVLQDTLPGGLTPTSGGTIAGQQVSQSLGTLMPGATQTFVVTAQVSSFGISQTLSNQAVVTATETGPVPSNTAITAVS